jgi:hypothetical protein
MAANLIGRQEPVPREQFSEGQRAVGGPEEDIAERRDLRLEQGHSMLERIDHSDEHPPHMLKCDPSPVRQKHRPHAWDPHQRQDTSSDERP